MANRKKKGMRPETLTAIVFIALIIGTFLLKIETYQQYIIMGVLVALFLFLRRSSLQFMAGATRIQKHPENPKVWNSFKKAIANGLDAERTVMVLTAFIQQNDAQYAAEQLEKLVERNKASKNPSEDVDKQARIALSMANWRLGNKEKAIDSSMELFEYGVKDSNLLVNLGSFLITENRLDEAAVVIGRCRSELPAESNGMLDNRGWLALLQGRTDEAKQVYETLINDNSAKFPEAYVHCAQTALKDERNIALASQCLLNAMTKVFIKTCEFTKEYVEKLAKGLCNPQTTQAFADAMLANEALVSRGQDFAGLEAADMSFELPAAEKLVLSFTRSESLEETSNEAGDEEDVVREIALDDDDDRIPNTDVTDEDDNWTSPEV